MILWVATSTGAADLPPGDDLTRARAAFEAAERAYRLGDFERALEGYERAYALVPKPELLFNMGQAQRNLERWEEAIFSFEGYLRDASSAPDREEVRALIADLEAEAQRARDPPIYERWWFWAGALVIVAGVSVTAVALATQEPDAPRGTLGTFDYR